MNGMASEFLSLALTAAAIPASIAGGFLARIRYVSFRTSREVRELRTLLNFGPGDLYVVFPQRDEVEIENAILPRGSTEDFFAINNLGRVFQRMGGDTIYRLRTDDRFMKDPGLWRHNVVTIGSNRSNDFTNMALAKLKWPFKVEDKDGVLCIHREDEEHGYHQWDSDTLRQQRANSADISAAELELDDIAVIAKYRNPWNPENLLLFIAGVRGIGTWGATYYLREKAQELYEHKSGHPKSGRIPVLTSYAPNGKDGDFIAILSVHYHNFRVVGADLQKQSFINI